MSNTLTIKLDKKTEKEVIELTQAGHKVEAMKIVLDKTKCGLSRAKEYVDKINPGPSIDLSDRQIFALHDALSKIVPEDIYVYEVAKPLTRPSPKLGRNELCDCGSGVKYKKCCWANNR